MLLQNPGLLILVFSLICRGEDRRERTKGKEKKISVSLVFALRSEGVKLYLEEE